MITNDLNIFKDACVLSGFLFYKLPVDVFCMFSRGDYSLVPTDFQGFCE